MSIAKGVGITFGVIGLFVLLTAIWFFFGGLLLMWAFGLLHAVFPAVPALGFWESCLVALGLRLLVGVAGFSKHIIYERNRD